MDWEEQQGWAERAEEGGDEASPETGGQRLQLRPEDCQVQGPGQTRKAGKEESQAGCRSGSKRWGRTDQVKNRKIQIVTVGSKEFWKTRQT